MVKSNIVTIVVKAPLKIPKPSVSKVELRVDGVTYKEVKVNEPVSLTAKIYFTTATPSSTTLTMDIYINGVKYDTYTISVKEGVTSTTYRFTLKFSKEGTYKIQVDVY